MIKISPDSAVSKTPQSQCDFFYYATEIASKPWTSTQKSFSPWILGQIESESWKKVSAISWKCKKPLHMLIQHIWFHGINDTAEIDSTASMTTRSLLHTRISLWIPIPYAKILQYGSRWVRIMKKTGQKISWHWWSWSVKIPEGKHQGFLN